MTVSTDRYLRSYISGRIAGLTLKGSAVANAMSDRVISKNELARILVMDGGNVNPVTVGVLVESLNNALAGKAVRNLRAVAQSAGRSLIWDPPDWKVPTTYEIRAIKGGGTYANAAIIEASLDDTQLLVPDLFLERYWVRPRVAFGLAVPVELDLQIDNPIPDQILEVDSPDRDPIILVVPGQLLEVLVPGRDPILLPFDPVMVQVRPPGRDPILLPFGSFAVQVRPPGRDPIVAMPFDPVEVQVQVVNPFFSPPVGPLSTEIIPLRIAWTAPLDISGLGFIEPPVYRATATRVDGVRIGVTPGYINSNGVGARDDVQIQASPGDRAFVDIEYDGLPRVRLGPVTINY